MNKEIQTAEQGASMSLQSHDATSKWARNRQIIYTLSVVVVLLLLSAYPLFKLFYTPPSCFDGKQNQDEVGIDCGGSSCNTLCITQVEDLTINWVKAFKINDGDYDIAASVENPNYNGEIKDVSYIFKIYDKNNSMITEKTGIISIKPRDKFIVFKPGVKTNGKVVGNVTFEFQENPKWIKTKQQPAAVTIKNKKLLNVKTSPRFNATIYNNSTTEDLSDVAIVAVIYNGRGNPIAVSSTYEKKINKGESKNIFFTWPNKFTTKPNDGVCTNPADVVLVFDRSGSMGFGGQDPPQPLTESKNAASVFVEDMKPKDQVGLISFATTASNPIDQTLTSEQSLVKKAIERIKIIPPALEQHTNIGDGIEKAVLELTSERDNTNMKKAIVLLTDGVASRPLNPKKKTDKDYPEIYASEKAQLARDNKISLYVIGLGDAINEKFLVSNIATAPDYYYKAATSGELKEIYNNIARAVCKEEVFTTDIVVQTK